MNSRFLLPHWSHSQWLSSPARRRPVTRQRPPLVLSSSRGRVCRSFPATVGSRLAEGVCWAAPPGVCLPTLAGKGGLIQVLLLPPDRSEPQTAAVGVRAAFDANPKSVKDSFVRRVSLLRVARRSSTSATASSRRARRQRAESQLHREESRGARSGYQLHHERAHRFGRGPQDDSPDIESGVIMRANKTLDRMTRSAVSRMFQCDCPWRAPRHRSALRSP